MKLSRSGEPNHDLRTVRRPSFGERHGGISTTIYEPEASRTLSGRLPTAAQRLRYEAVLDAVGHMGDDIEIVEYRDYAVAKRVLQFVAIRPDIATGHLAVGLAIAPDKDERLAAVRTGEWTSGRLISQFSLESHQPLQGWQLKLLRLSYLAAGEVDETWLARR